MSAVEVDVADVPMRDRIRWGPIIAGVVTAFAVLLFLTVLGIALGLSALGGDDDPGTWGTAAGIWGGLTLLVAFFVGGWMAARSAATMSDSDGPLNGFVTGAATLLLLLWLATTALTGALGFFAGTVADIAGAAGPAAMEAVEEGAVAVPADAENTATEAVEDPAAAVPPEAQEAAETAAEAAGPGAWGTTIAIILAIAAATLGGMVGRNERMVLPGSRTVVATR
ncbi:MAG: hypothetical protein KY456_06280 [Chloroflexi bacterium]|nr:hypothetical protein [Chloroflexota bacterium]